ncbi:MAG TPA: bacillithiol biosynthesis BshC [Thermoanaerobaculia bacterium]
MTTASTTPRVVRLGTVPFSRYPGLPELFTRFLAGAPEFYPDPPTPEAAAERGRELLGTHSRIPASAFRFRGAAAGKSAEDLAAGRAVAVIAGHQVGLFTGPLFTIVKAFDVIRVAREIRERGVPAVPVFWALTDDHDLEEVARTAKPGKDGPEVLVLEGADRANRTPVGRLPIPARVTELLDAFAADARAPGAGEIVEAFRRRYAPGATYGDAFIETLLDLAGEELLVLDPYQDAVRPATAEFFRLAARKRGEMRDALAGAASRIEKAGIPVPVPFRPDVFPLFTIARGERRRVEDPDKAAERVASGEEWPSSDVLTRPVLKSWLVPTAATVLGPSELAYHSQALSLFPIFGLNPPVLFPRSFVVPVGPAERRAIEALGVPDDALLLPAPASAPVDVPGAPELARGAEAAERSLAELEPSLTALDPTLAGALENTRKKVAYQFEQLAEKMKKAAERKDEVSNQRRKRLDTMLLPQGGPAERLYPPLVPMLAYGPAALEAIRKAAAGSLEGAVVADVGAEPDGR